MNENLKKIQLLTAELTRAASDNSLHALDLVKAFEENLKYIKTAKAALVEREKNVDAALNEMRENMASMFTSLKNDFNTLQDEYTTLIEQIKGTADASTESN